MEEEEEEGDSEVENVCGGERVRRRTCAEENVCGGE